MFRRKLAHPERGSLKLKDLKGHIEFQGITFSYPTRLEVRCNIILFYTFLKRTFDSDCLCIRL
jgi:hypothetical protein